MIVLLEATLRLLSHLSLRSVWAITRVTAAIAEIAAEIAPSSGRVTVARNLAACYPEMTPADRARLRDQVMIETWRTLFETALAWYATPERCREFIKEVSGEQAVTSALESGHGVMLILPHLGNWEILNHYLGHAYHLTHMYQPSDDAAFDSLVLARRARSGTRFVAVGQSGLKAQASILQSGGVIGTMNDQEPPVYRGLFAEFFGVPAWTGTTTPRLAMATGATVFVAWCERREDGRCFAVNFRPVAAADRTPEGFNRAIEAAVRESPAQYLWSYKRFRTRPAGEGDFYRSSGIPRRFRQDEFDRATRLQARCAGVLATIAGFIPSTLHDPLAKLVAQIAFAVNARAARDSLTNTAIGAAQAGRDAAPLATASLHESTKQFFAAMRCWHQDAATFEREVATSCLSEIDDALGSSGVLVLTPPLGNREVLMRALGARYRATEYYHEAARPHLDALIRARRSAWGIRLQPHTAESVETLICRLRQHELVTLCPDQQPRLNTGTFVPFFAEPALTANAIAAFVEQAQPAVYFAFALPCVNGYQLHLRRWNIPSIPGECESHELAPETGLGDGATTRILTDLNRVLETLICTYPVSYRWHDRRFNIRPEGVARLYQRRRR